jgi:N-dimethylarginine dimethylaminohydrolase
MCPPTHFAVEYAINPWMRTDCPVDLPLAVHQWDTLRRSYLELGHAVEQIEPVPGLPDMVFAANGALVLDGVAMPARFRHPERAPEAAAYREWLCRNDFRVLDSVQVNEGEGDFLVVGDLILAGTGFRTHPKAHDEAQELLGRAVVTLQLIDPRFYHLDTALAVLDDSGTGPAPIAYYPQAFSPGSRAVLSRLFPDAVIATAADAGVLGLNAVSDGENVVLPAAATGLAAALRAADFRPVPVDLSELLKAGGGPKCCTLELREK